MSSQRARLILISGAMIIVVSACSRRGDKKAADSASMASPGMDAAATIPFNASIDCTRASSGIDTLVCGDPALLALDQKLGTVYKEAETKQGSPVPAGFIAEQRGWNATRDACGTSSNLKGCIDSAYTRRIAAIQATSLLVPTKGPITYNCTAPGDAHDEVIAMYADTDPPTVVLERGDKSIVAYFAKSSGGARYVGPGVTLVDKGGEVQVGWMGSTLKCHEQAASS